MKKENILKIIIGILIITNLLFLGFILTRKEDKNIDYCFYENNENYVLVEKNNLGNNLESYLYKDSNDNYLGKIYEYGSSKEVNITDLIKEDKREDYENKVSELLYLKYPKFVASSLLEEDVQRNYLLRDNELVIYFSNYTITPMVEELLYLKINYNEIKDYVNFTVLLDSEYQIESGYNYTKSKKSVAISFDDSPNKGKTNKILEYLEDNHFHATFFVVGERTINNENLLISMKNSGNEIGSHTYSHSNMRKMSETAIINDYEKMNAIYRNLFTEDLSLVRPPYGALNKSEASILDVSFIMWSLDTNDWRYRNKDYLINYVMDNIKDGDIILFHDAYDSTVEAISELLPLLYSKGYQVMSVSELFNLKEKPLEKKQIYYRA